MTTRGCRRTGRVAAGFSIGMALLLIAPSPAWAHGDARLARGTTTIAPGEDASFRADVHYHRLVGTVSADGPVLLRLTRPGAELPTLELGPAPSLTINELVACCDDGPWTPHELVIANPGTAPVVVDPDLTLVHDDLAVMVFGAEAGTRASVVVLGAAWVALLWRAVRRRRPDASLRGAALRLGAVAGGAVAGAWVGAVRYGTDGPPALVAVLSDVPVLPMNPAVSRASLLLGLAILGWGGAGVRWARARPSAARTPWLVLGLALVAGPLGTAVLVADAYGAGGLPAAAGVTAAAPLVAVLVLGSGDASTARWWRRSVTATA